MRVREATVAGRFATPITAFPEWFTKPAEPEAEKEPEDVVYDYSAVDWKMPSQEDPTETLKLLAAMGHNRALTLDDEEQPTGPFDPETLLFDEIVGDFDDREWT